MSAVLGKIGQKAKAAQAASDLVHLAETPAGLSNQTGETTWTEKQGEDANRLNAIRQLALDLLFAVSFLRPFGRASSCVASVAAPESSGDPATASFRAPSPHSISLSSPAPAGPPVAFASAASAAPGDISRVSARRLHGAGKRPETPTLRQICPTYALHTELVEKATSLRELTLYLLVCFGPLLELLHRDVEQKSLAASPSLEAETRAARRQNEQDAQGKEEKQTDVSAFDGRSPGPSSTFTVFSVSSGTPEDPVQVSRQLASLLSDKLKGIGAILQVLTETKSSAGSRVLDAVCDALAAAEHPALKCLPQQFASSEKGPDSRAAGGRECVSMEVGEDAEQCGSRSEPSGDSRRAGEGVDEQGSMAGEKDGSPRAGESGEEGARREATKQDRRERAGRTEGGLLPASASSELIAAPLWSAAAQEILEHEHGLEKGRNGEERAAGEAEADTERGDPPSSFRVSGIEKTVPAQTAECSNVRCTASGEHEETDATRRFGEDSTPSETLPKNLQWIAQQLATPLENLRGDAEEEQLLREQISRSFCPSVPSSESSAPAARSRFGLTQALRRGEREEASERRSEETGDGEALHVVSGDGPRGEGRREQAAGDELDSGGRKEETTETERARMRSETLAAELIDILENENYKKHLRVREKQQQGQLLLLLRKLQEHAEDSGDLFLGSTHEKNSLAGYSGLFSAIPSGVYESLPPTGVPSRETPSPLSSFASRLASKRASVSSSSGGLPAWSCTTTASLQASSSSQCTSANAYSPLSSTPTSPASLLSPPQNLFSQQPVWASGDTLSSPLLLPSSSLSLALSTLPHRLTDAPSHTGGSSLSGETLLCAKDETGEGVGKREGGASTSACLSQRGPDGKTPRDCSAAIRATELAAESLSSAAAPLSTFSSLPEGGVEKMRAADGLRPSLPSSSASALRVGQRASGARAAERFSSGTGPTAVLPTAVQLFLRKRKGEFLEREPEGDSGRHLRDGRGKQCREEGLSPHFASLALPYSTPACEGQSDQGAKAAPASPIDSGSSSIPSLLGSSAARGEAAQADEMGGTAGGRDAIGRDLPADLSFPFSAFLSRVVARAQEEETQARRGDPRNHRNEANEKVQCGDSERRPDARKATARRGGGSAAEGLEDDAKRTAKSEHEETDEGLFFRHLALHLVRLAKREQDERQRGRPPCASETYSIAEAGSMGSHAFPCAIGGASDRTNSALWSSPSDFDRPGEPTPWTGLTKVGSFGSRTRTDRGQNEGVPSLFSSLSTNGPGIVSESPSCFGPCGGRLSPSAFDLSRRPAFGEDGDRNGVSLPSSGGDLSPHLVPYTSPELRPQSTRRLEPLLSSFSDPSHSAAGDASRLGECLSGLSPPLKDGGAARSVADSVSPFVGSAGVSPFVGCRGSGGGDCRCGGPETGCMYRSGVSGVVYDKSGQKWTARWNEDGKQHKRTFAAAKYGFLNAKMRAEACRGEARERAAARARQATERSHQRRTDASKGTRGIGERERSRPSCVASPSFFRRKSLSVRSGRGGEEERERGDDLEGEHPGEAGGMFLPESVKPDSEAEGEGRREHETERGAESTVRTHAQETVKSESKDGTSQDVASPASSVGPVAPGTTERDRSEEEKGAEKNESSVTEN
ncbi:unnamed protein product [Neospora caninum Liverpool]|nr:uncharacterized protein NCLIV_011370 [Neospora caninum Liverpool]CBZ50671.1 unnamed protein product [Neospora caninum Liverpool]|eukprot:XP_003880704.1 uncharacterized protein NCLIV_011370 [Neospora caninum Liverpool]